MPGRMKGMLQRGAGVVGVGEECLTEGWQSSETPGKKGKEDQ